MSAILAFNTVEDPSADFIRLRDFVDASECSKLQAFSAEKLKKGFSEEMAKEGQEKRKINKVCYIHIFLIRIMRLIFRKF